MLGKMLTDLQWHILSIPIVKDKFECPYFEDKSPKETYY